MFSNYDAAEVPDDEPSLELTLCTPAPKRWGHEFSDGDAQYNFVFVDGFRLSCGRYIACCFLMKFTVALKLFKFHLLDVSY
jgi:hypothetical protein